MIALAPTTRRTTCRGHLTDVLDDRSSGGGAESRDGAGSTRRAPCQGGQGGATKAKAVGSMRCLSSRSVAAAAVVLPLCTAPSGVALGAAAVTAVCDYARNAGSYREAGPIQGGVPQPSGNLACHWGAKVPLAQFKSECDGEPRCVGFSYTAPASEGSEPPAEGEGCLKNNYDPHVWGHQPGFDGYDKGSPKLTAAFAQSSYILMTYRVVGTKSKSSVGAPTGRASAFAPARPGVCPCC